MTGRTWAYIGAVLGGAVSIAANVAHVYVVNPHPAALAVAVSVFWPVALFVAVEILARTPWPSAWRWLALRFLGVAPVALVAAVVSYRHLSGLLFHYGEDPVTVTIGPLGVDGLMLVATSALLVPRKRAEAERNPEEAATEAGRKPAEVVAEAGEIERKPEEAAPEAEETLREAEETAREVIAEAEEILREAEETAREVIAEAEEIEIPPKPRPAAATRKAAEALLAAGKSRKEAAEILGITERRLRQVLPA